MPKLSDYFQERELLPPGLDDVKFSEVSVSAPQDESKKPSLIYKGKTVDGDKPVNVFRYLHDKMYWQVADDLASLGVTSEDDVPEFDDADALASFIEPLLIGKVVRVQIKQRTYTTQQGESRTDNNFKLKGYSDGASGV